MMPVGWYSLAVFMNIKSAGFVFDDDELRHFVVDCVRGIDEGVEAL